MSEKLCSLHNKKIFFKKETHKVKEIKYFTELSSNNLLGTKIMKCFSRQPFLFINYNCTNVKYH